MHPTSVYFHYILLFHFPSSYFRWLSQCHVDTGVVIYIGILLFCDFKWCIVFSFRYARVTGYDIIVFLVLFCSRCQVQQYHLYNMRIVYVNLLLQSLLHKCCCLELIIIFMIISCNMCCVSIIVVCLAWMVQRLGGDLSFMLTLFPLFLSFQVLFDIDTSFFYFTLKVLRMVKFYYVFDLRFKS